MLLYLYRITLNLVMKKSLLIFGLLLFAHLIYAQKIVYKVKSGDTLYNISKTHNVSIGDLYEMNPGLEQNGLKEGTEIHISLNRENVTNGKLIYSKTPEISNVASNQYRVQKGDTLYSISKKFNLSVEELIKRNEGLTAENLKVDQILNITESHYIKNQALTLNSENAYTVVKGDTFYSLAKRFHTDEATLKTYNPVLVNGLKIGQEIYFPTVEDGFIIHKVKKGETIFSIVRKYNVSLDILLKHNPDLKNGLNAGMELKIPVESIVEEIKIVDDGYLNVVYILPFNSKDYELSEKRSFMTTEFYMGSLFALDSLASKGKKIQVKTFDNKATLSETKAIAQKIDFNKTDLIIGPLRSDNVHWIADYVKDKKIKVISPFSNGVDVAHRENLIKANLTQESLIEGLSNKILQGNQTDSIFVIGNDNPDFRIDLKKQFQNSYVEQITSIKEYDFTKMSKKSSIVLNTMTASVAKAALEKMHEAKIQDRKIKTFAVGYNASYVKGRGFNEAFLGDELLTDLGLTVIIPNYFNDNKENVYKTKNDYRKINEAFPDKYSSAGFDWTYYMILNNEFKNPNKIQEGLFNKIQLNKTENGGYVNKGLFLIQY